VAGAGGPGLGIDVLAVPGADHGLGRPFDVAAVVGWVLARLAGEGVG
jgi:hypothetical protein